MPPEMLATLDVSIEALTRVRAPAGAATVKAAPIAATASRPLNFVPIEDTEELPVTVCNLACKKPAESMQRTSLRHDDLACIGIHHKREYRDPVIAKSISGVVFPVLVPALVAPHSPHGA